MKSSAKNMTKVSIIGLGKLGASMAAGIASRGFPVIGMDVNRRAVDRINEGHAPVQETGLEEAIAANRKRIRATGSHLEAILDSDLSFVIVPTPSDERGGFSLSHATAAFKEIGRALAAKRGYHNVVLTSTVLPGSTRYGLLPVLENESGKKCGADFGLCYSPEFIALGSVIHDFLHPDFTLVGEFDDRCGGQLDEFYGRLLPEHPPCQRMSIENAELTKISLNAFVTTKITFANMLAELCEKIPGGDIDIVTRTLGLDRRIGAKYLTGGLGYGGPCFPRDNVALAFMARVLGLEASLAEATDRFNRRMPAGIIEHLQAVVTSEMTVAVLGLAYKPHSHVTEESQGMALARALGRAGVRVISYDPLAGEGARSELAGHALVLDSLADCLNQADVVLVTTPDPAFKAIRAEDIKKRPVTVVDFWRILGHELIGRPDIRYIPAGRSIDDEANGRRLKDFWGGGSGAC